MVERQVVVPAAQKHVHDEWHIAPAVTAQGIMYCSGVLGDDEAGAIAPDPKEQYHQVFRNLGTLLGEAGADYGNIVEILSFHVDLENQIMLFSEVKDQYIKGPYPAWTAVEVAGLGAGAFPGALVEVKVTALL